MHVNKLFRLSTYLSLGLATACLWFAENGVLPGIGPFALFIAALLIVLFLLEQRVTLTPRAARILANLLGLAIIVGGGTWVAFHPYRPPDDELIEDIPIVRLLLYFGPLLMMLTVVKLLLPKRTRDFWTLHCIGLIQVVLGCFITTHPLFGLLLFAYLTCTLWSLMFFYLHREQAGAGQWEVLGGADARQTVPATMAEFGPVSRADARRRFPGLGRAVVWALAVLSVAFGVFLLTPQKGHNAFASRLAAEEHVELGPSPDSINLNRLGQIDTTDRVAFEVFAEDADHNPKAELDREQYWRGSTLTWYESGRWFRHDPQVLRRTGPNSGWQTVADIGGQAELADLGPNQFFLTFTIDPRQTSGLYLAEPVITFPRRSPHQSVTSLMNDPEPVTLHFQHDGSLVPSRPLRGGKFRYKQATLPAGETILRRAMEKNPGTLRIYPYATRERIADWTARLLERLVAEGKLSRDDLATYQAYLGAPRKVNQQQGRAPLPAAAPLASRLKEQRLRDENFEKIARALVEHMEHSGEFSYSLEQRRGDFTLDPVEDFLFNVKDGHCERFAGGLTLMLRSIGIQARVVVGFRGAEKGTDPGQFFVMNSHAHSWVEACVHRYHPAYENVVYHPLRATGVVGLALTPATGTLLADGFAYDTARDKTFYPQAMWWLTLDPSPRTETGTAETSRLVTFWRKLEITSRSWWQSYVVEYNTDQQADMALGAFGQVPWRQRTEEVGDWARGAAARPAWLLLAFLGAGVLVGFRWLRRLRRGRDRGPGLPPEYGFYSRLLDLLDRRLGLRPGPAQTPRELADEAGRKLRNRISATPLVRLPAQVVRLFYRARYGGRPLSATEIDEVEGRLTQLDAALGNPT